MKKEFTLYGFSESEIDELEKIVEEANERLKRLNEEGHETDKAVLVTVLGVEYSVMKIEIGYDEENYYTGNSLSCCTFFCSDGSKDDYQFVASKQYLEEYIGILRMYCQATSTYLSASEQYMSEELSFEKGADSETER